MIVGIGTDLASIPRIRAVLDRHGARFQNRVYTPHELARAARAHDPAPILARRWAAKEAMSKALGTGVAMGINWREMWVTNAPSGQPLMHVAGKAAARLAGLIPPGHTPHIHVSLTDDDPWAQAFVVIEALPTA